MTWARLPRRDASTGLLRSGPGVTGWQWLSLRRQSLSACNWFGAGDWSRGREAEGTGLEYQRTQARSVRSNRTDSTRGRPSLAVTARAHCLFSRSKNRRHFGKTEKVSAGHISALASGSRPQIRLLARRPGESGKCQAVEKPERASAVYCARRPVEGETSTGHQAARLPHTHNPSRGSETAGRAGLPTGDTMSFLNWTITAVHGDVHIDGESGTIDDAEQHVARVRAAIDRAKEQRAAVSVGFRALQHAGEMAAHDHERDQRTEH